MSASPKTSTPGVVDTLARIGVSLVLHLRDRKQPIYVDVVAPLRFGRVVVRPWGCYADMTIDLENIRSATTPDIGYREYRRIRSVQRDAEQAEQAIVQLDDLTPEERSDEIAQREDEERGPILPPTPRGFDGWD